MDKTMIRNIDVLHTSFTPDGELVDNFAIVDFLLKHIDELEIESDELADKCTEFEEQVKIAHAVGVQDAGVENVKLQERVKELEAQVRLRDAQVAFYKELEAIPRDEADGFNKIIAHYQQQVAGLEAEVEGLTANNANLVEKNAFLRQRPDLPVDRIPAYTALQTKVYEMIKVMEAARDDLLMRGDIDSQGCRVVNMSATTWNNFCDAIDKAALKEGE